WPGLYGPRLTVISMVACRPGWSVPLPNAMSAFFAVSAICRRKHGYSGAYLASKSSGGREGAANWIRLFLLTCKKFFRSMDAVVKLAYKVDRLAFCSATVFDVTVRSVSAWTSCGAASLYVFETPTSACRSCCNCGTCGLISPTY